MISIHEQLQQTVGCKHRMTGRSSGRELRLGLRSGPMPQSWQESPSAKVHWSVPVLLLLGMYRRTLLCLVFPRGSREMPASAGDVPMSATGAFLVLLTAGLTMLANLMMRAGIDAAGGFSL